MNLTDSTAPFPLRSVQKLQVLSLLLTFIASQSFASSSDWSVYLGDSNGSHYSPLRQIDTENVNHLTVAWTYHTGDASTNNRSQIQCNPLILDGVLYGTTPQLKVFALDAATGEEKWVFDPFASGNDRAALGVSRGLVHWSHRRDHRLFHCAGHYLHAINLRDGSLIDSFGDHGKVDLRKGLDRELGNLHVVGNTPGAIYRDTLIIATRVGEGPGPSAPGHIRAYDVRTGQRKWIFHTIPHPGEPGYETWPPDSWQHAGGANCWAGLVIDRDSGIAYIPTGSAAFDFWGGNRIGQNLFGNSLLALDAESGARQWHFQIVHHDLWDRDLPAPPVLLEVRRNGKKVPAVAQITKSGHVWVFDRRTGRPLFPWTRQPAPASDIPAEVAWTNQPVPLAPPPFARQHFTEDLATDLTPASHAAVLKRLRENRPHQPWDPPSRRGTIVFPGFDGGGEWGGAAVDPNSGVLYVNGNEMPWILNLVDVRPSDGPGASGHIAYLQLCAPCHGIDRSGDTGRAVPSLAQIASKMKAPDIIALLSAGKGVMPSFDFLKPSEKEALAAYLLGENPPTPSPRANASPDSAPTRPQIPYTITGYNRFLDPEGYPAVKPPWGTLNAIDLNSGNFLWRVPLGEIPELTARGIPPTGTENYGGPIVTGGNLVFIAATKDEKMRAFDQRTGRVLWQSQLPAAGYATPATYRANGRQFVVIACGGGKIGTKSGDAYVAFALPK